MMKLVQIVFFRRQSVAIFSANGRSETSSWELCACQIQSSDDGMED